MELLEVPVRSRKIRDKDSLKGLLRVFENRIVSYIVYGHEPRSLQRYNERYYIKSRICFERIFPYIDDYDSGVEIKPDVRSGDGERKTDVKGPGLFSGNTKDSRLVDPRTY